MEKPIQFNEITWENPKKGMFQKVYTSKTSVVRLVSFNDQFIEEDWCQKNHSGYVLKGKFQLDFFGKLESYQKGDALILENNSKHKIMVPKGEVVDLILFERP